MTITHHPEKQQFTIEVEGHTAHIDYELANNVMDITHTIVPEAIGGRGIAGQLMEAALNTAKEKAWKVIPSCSYAAVYIKRHPEFADLLI
ncbi:GNAT family N-acetyltransferase [Pelistega suis]|uniref:GNAT family N-acetyltransferase n=1 Tax=Pelistega suis TaxID=1631957 RepID=UPI00211CE022|nr:GNAT family N-acetyltransferase [Pelistega suis]MCQ9328363.1 N-acetyltransferase [Pelistega suis]